VFLQDQPELPALVDTHCHLDFNVFDEDREQILIRARQAGVTCILNPGIDLESSRNAVKLAQSHKEVYAAVGVHPNDALGWDEATLQEIGELAGSPKVVAIGEIGLDYYWHTTPPDLQKKALRSQLNLAARLGLPVVIHNREATEDILAILEDWCSQLSASSSLLAKRPGVLHSYSAGERFIQQVMEMNFFIGITGPVTFRKALDLHQLVSTIPLENLLIETDAPFMSPHPHRGQRNEPAFVRYVAERIAILRENTYPVIAGATTANAARLFNW
jgi:TatD DNase family protein